MIPPGDDFPRLTPTNHRVTSPATPDYNCIAWAAGDTTRWWQPGMFWPAATGEDDYGVAVLIAAFAGSGFVECGLDGGPERGFEKVALYGSALLYTHAARQLPNGKWTSKLGKAEDIEHETPQDVSGGIYGEVVRIMKRPVVDQP